MGTNKLLRGRLSYDPSFGVIHVDVSGIVADSEAIIDDLFDGIEELARSHPDCYVLACWEDAEMVGEAVIARYGLRTAELLTLVRQVVRYGLKDPITRSIVRTQAIRHVAAGVRSNLFATQADAVQYVIDERARLAKGPTKP